MRKHNLLLRAFYCGLGFLILWLAGGYICFKCIEDKMMVWLFSSSSTFGIFVISLLYYLDKEEVEITSKQRETINKILKAVCELHDCTMDDLLGTNKSRQFAFARYDAAFIMKEHLKMDYSEIAEVLHRQRPAIYNMIEQVTNDIQRNDRTRIDRINQLQQLLTK